MYYTPEFPIRALRTQGCSEDGVRTLADVALWDATLLSCVLPIAKTGSLTVNERMSRAAKLTADSLGNASATLQYYFTACRPAAGLDGACNVVPCQPRNL